MPEVANFLRSAYDFASTSSYDIADDFASTPAYELSRKLAYTLHQARTVDPKLYEALQKLKDELPNPEEDLRRFKQYWETKGQDWTERLREVMKIHRNIGQNWQFNDEQEEKLKQYYETNSLLVYCLHRSGKVTEQVKLDIEKKLLLPMNRMEAWIPDD